LVSVLVIFISSKQKHPQLHNLPLTTQAVVGEQLLLEWLFFPPNDK
jgi:hypothetical protein